MSKQVIHPRERRLIDRHFSRRIAPQDEVVMRNHLADCRSCRDHYDRHALLAQVDPQVAPARERLAVALGFAPSLPAPLAAGRAPWRWAALLVPLAVALIFVVARRRPIDDSDAGFAARGTRVEPGLYAYRVSQRHPLPVAGRMPAGEELAFAYENPTKYGWLMVVAVDGTGSVFWYHPDPDTSDRAIRISKQPGRHELPVAIRHEYAGDRLRILGIFSSQALSLADVRPLIDRSGCEGVRSRLASGVACVEVNVALGEETKP
jgi:hypothetical protein